MKKVMPRILICLAVYATVMAGQRSATAAAPPASLAAYDSLSAMARRNGYPDLAAAAVGLKDYRIELERCTPEDGYKSSPEFGLFLDSFARTLNDYIQNASRRKAYRVEVEAYVRNATSLGRQYLYEKAKRFNGGADKMDARDQEIVRLSYIIHRQTAQALQVGQSTSAERNLSQLRAEERDPRWTSVVQAILHVNDDVRACTIK